MSAKLTYSSSTKENPSYKPINKPRKLSQKAVYSKVALIEDLDSVISKLVYEVISVVSVTIAILFASILYIKFF